MARTKQTHRLPGVTWVDHKRGNYRAIQRRRGGYPGAGTMQVDTTSKPQDETPPDAGPSDPETQPVVKRLPDATTLAQIFEAGNRVAGRKGSIPAMQVDTACNPHDETPPPKQATRRRRDK